VFTKTYHQSYYLRQMNAIYALPPYFFKLHFNIIPFMPGFSKWYFLFNFSKKNVV
jgi:hypothetical protein